MNIKKSIIIPTTLALGIGASAILYTPKAMNAASNVVLASVDWVTSQLNPINSKISTLEAKINAQQLEINNLKSQLGNPVPPETNTVYVTKSTVNIYSGASTSYKVVATKTSGTALKYIETFQASTGLWYRVELSSTLKGWVFSGDVSTTKPTTTQPTQVVTTGEAYLRSGASTSYKILKTLPKGTSLKYLQTYKNAQGETWYNVQTSDGTKGWIFGGLAEVR